MPIFPETLSNLPYLAQNPSKIGDFSPKMAFIVEVESNIWGNGCCLWCGRMNRADSFTFLRCSQEGMKKAQYLPGLIGDGILLASSLYFFIIYLFIANQ